MQTSSASRSAWERLGLSQPIISAPMAGVSGGALAGAVRAAGGLGLVAVGHGATGAYIEAEVGGLARQPAESAGSWGVGLMAWSQELEDYAALRAVLEFNPPVIALAAGDPLPGARLAKAAGALVAVQVGTAAEVDLALEHADIDLVVVRGAEAGGHGLNAVATLPLLQYAVQARAARHLDKPIAVGGGVATPAGLAAVLAAGAQAGWVGTRFIPTAESLFAPALREAVANASLEGTVYTSVFDLSLGLPWPSEYGGRALRNDVADRWAGSDAALRESLRREEPEAMALRERVTAARAAGDPTAAPVYAGQGAGLLAPTDTWPSAADVVTELAAARDLLRAAAGTWA